MTIGPIGAISASPTYALRAVAASRPTAPEPAPALVSASERNRDFVLHGDSGLIIQSYGAIALISNAGLALSSLSSNVFAKAPAIAPVEALDKVTRSTRV